MSNIYRFGGGLALSLAVAILAQYLTRLPAFSIFGAMVIAILLGILVRAVTGNAVSAVQTGVSFTAKYVLRAGIILMGIRLNISDIVAAGWQTVFLDMAVIIFALLTIHYLGVKYNVGTKLTTLLAVGTGVCGAAAIGAVTPLVKAEDEEIAVSVSIIAILGTVFAVAYTSLLPLLALSPHSFGVFVGSTLHELAHVIAAAASVGPESSDTAILVKLGRVAFVAPVAMLFGWWYSRRERQGGSLTLSQLPIPWFIFGFLGMAAVNTAHILSAGVTAVITQASIVLLTMSMAALGLNVSIRAIRRVSYRPVVVCLLGSVMLSVFGRVLVWALNF